MHEVTRQSNLKRTSAWEGPYRRPHSDGWQVIVSLLVAFGILFIAGLIK